MSALGQKQTCAVQNGMSALHPKADMCGATRDVRFVPKRTSPALFDHLVGAPEQRRWNGKAKRFRRLEIDHQFKFGRRRTWKIGRLLALEDAIDIVGRAPKIIAQVSSVGQQAAALSEETVCIDGREMVASRQRYDLLPIGVRPSGITIRPPFGSCTCAAKRRI